MTKRVALPAVLLIAASVVLLIFRTGSNSQSESAANSESLSELPVATVQDEAEPAQPQYAGKGVCVECHVEQVEVWTGSHHDLAMQVPDTNSVAGNFADASFSYHGIETLFFTQDNAFFVRTDGPDGAMGVYQIKYVFGVFPLQQYLVELPGGRLQALGIAWDSRAREAGGQRWFHLYPDEKITHRDTLHWSKPSQNWNSVCADCHSTNVQKKYSVQTNSYATTYSDMDVSCEACHGPGSDHVQVSRARDESAFQGDANGGLVTDFRPAVVGQWQFAESASTASLDEQRDTSGLLETCARCHSRRTPLKADAVHKETFYDSHTPGLLESGFYHADGQVESEVYEFGSFIQSKMHASGVSCIDCHEPHSLKLRAQGNRVCAQCHLPAVYDTRAHHLHIAESPGAQCVSCHMPEKMFAQVDGRRDHSFRIPRPDLSDKLGAPDVCTSCHTNQAPDWAAKAIEASTAKAEFGLHYGEALYAGRRQSADAPELLQQVAVDKNQPLIARATALSMLGEYSTGEIVTTLLIGIESPDPMLRRAALLGASGIPVQERYRLAGKLLLDPVRSVRMTAVEELAGINRVQLTAAAQREFFSVTDEYIDIQNENADRGSAHTKLGNLHRALGETEQAIQEFELSIQIEPLFIPGYIDFADFYRSIGDDDRAEEILRRAALVKPGIADAESQKR
jgi:tetratricopeptide (TPR) repeat protein